MKWVEDGVLMEDVEMICPKCKGTMSGICEDDHLTLRCDCGHVEHHTEHKHKKGGRFRI